MKIKTSAMSVAGFLSAASGTVSAQPFAIETSTVDVGGGAMEGATYALAGTIGQPDAGRLIGLTYAIEGGFWPAARRSSCPADVAAPFGVLDIDDVLSFLNAFSLADPLADLVPPEGVFDIDDVLSFLGLFSSGCP